jgi:hypothetical protein
MGLGSVHICSLSWSCNFVLYVIVNRVKGGAGVKPEPSPARADFSIVMECTPEIGHCQSVGTLWTRARRNRRREKQRLNLTGTVNTTGGTEGGKSQPGKAYKQGWER